MTWCRYFIGSAWWKRFNDRFYASSGVWSLCPNLWSALLTAPKCPSQQMGFYQWQKAYLTSRVLWGAVSVLSCDNRSFGVIPVRRRFLGRRNSSELFRSASTRALVDDGTDERRDGDNFSICGGRATRQPLRGSMTYLFCILRSNILLE